MTEAEIIAQLHKLVNAYQRLLRLDLLTAQNSLSASLSMPWVANDPVSRLHLTVTAAIDPPEG